MTDLRSVHEIYTRWAFAYDAFTCLTETRSLEAALSGSAVRDGEAVLEVAVGTGAAFAELLARNPSGRNVGIDLTEAMLRRARQKAERTRVPHELAIGDARALCFETGAFDVVINNNMFGLLPEAEFVPILTELARVLRPGGRLAIVTMGRPSRRLAAWLYDLVPVWFGGWREIELAPFVLTAGLELVDRRTVEQLGIPSEVLLAHKR